MTATRDFLSFDFHDAEIIDLRLDPPNLRLVGKDWAGKEFVVVFRETAGFEGFNCLQGEIGSARILKKDSFIERAAAVTGEDEENRDLRLFEMIDAWDNTPLLRVVAQGVEISYE